MLVDVCKFCSESSTTLAFWRSDVRHAHILEIWGAQSSIMDKGFHGPCRRHHVLLQTKHHARILDLWGAQNASEVLNFKQNLQTVTRIVILDFYNPGDCLQVLFEIEHHARVSEHKFAPRSHSGGLGSTILDDVA